MDSFKGSQVEDIVRTLCGEPNKALSKPGAWRYGTNGSLAINLEKATWYDHERGIGGGILDLVIDKQGGDRASALDWLSEQGFISETTKRQKTQKVKATYPYHSLDGDLLFEVVRFVPKNFRPRRPDGSGGFIWNLKGVTPVLYRLSDLVSSAPNEIVFLVEGEKDVDRLRSIGLVSTTCHGGANKWRQDYADALKDRQIVIIPDNDNAGQKHADRIMVELDGVATCVAILTLPDLPTKGDVSDWLDQGGDVGTLMKLAQDALLEYSAAPRIAPTPLFAKRPKPSPYPLKSLGPLLHAAEAIEAATQARPELAAMSVLMSASFAVQSFADVETIHGHRSLSLFGLSIAASGERKSTCDKMATDPIREFEQKAYIRYQRAFADWQSRLEQYGEEKKATMRSAKRGRSEVVEVDDLGLPPTPPRSPAMLLSDTTTEGITRFFEEGGRSAAIFSSEGGILLGGHAMRAENKLRTGAAISLLWDGEPIKRVRASGPPQIYFGRRVSLHLMVQPGVADEFLGDEQLRDQGLISRLLLAWPDSVIGYREVSSEPVRTSAELQAYYDRINSLLELEPPTRSDDADQLDPRRLSLSPSARALLVEYAQAVENAQRPKEEFASITGVASKSAEQAARIAGVLTLFANVEATEVSESEMKDGIILAMWHLKEAKRILDVPETSQLLKKAQKLVDWLRHCEHGPTFSVRTMQRNAPNSLRNAELLRKLIKILVEHGHLQPVVGLAKNEEPSPKKAWRIIDD